MTEDPHFFPVVSTLTDLGGGNEVDDSGSYFFVPISFLFDISMSSMSLDFHDCPCLEDDSSLFTNWMNLEIFNDITYLDCSQGSIISTAPSTTNCPTPLAYNSLVRGGIPRSFDDTAELGDLFYIIVDSGESLSTSPHKSDFVGTIQKVDLRLGGMANGMIIEGKGKLEWSFVTLNGRILTINTLCYYVPDCKVRLFSPQRLFSKSNGTPGKFIIEEEQTTLVFDELSHLTIQNDHRNHLPTHSS